MSGSNTFHCERRATVTPAAHHAHRLEHAVGTASGPRLISAALIGIAVIVVLITRFPVHPFLGLTIGSLVVAAIAGLPIGDAVESFTTGFGSTAAGVGTLLALGAMFGKLLAGSGGADQIVDTIVGRSSTRGLPWAMAAVGALIGLPMFLEIGLVLLMPVIFLVARRSGLSPVVLIAMPTVVIAGPLFARYAARWVDIAPPALFEGTASGDSAPHGVRLSSAPR